ncbi:unnamed protein product [Cylicocyclus nassatus]|uniref:Transmembrane protein n=1 Tax=Cylicocyclus nassatus TaxID=53992 RepID=A0AA36GL89_CYLNA|nr:unnamed protein product [Cylicocyclus nassatus]
MGSPSLEPLSPANSFRRVERKGTTGRLRAHSEHYLWLFGQMHAKRFLVFAHLLFLALSVWLLWNVSAVEFAGLPVPGLDGLLPFDVPVREALREGDNDSLFLSHADVKPYLDTSRTIASLLGYMYFFSTLMGLAVMRAIDGVWQRDGVSPLFCVNPALFLLPFLFSVLSLGGMLFLWSVRSGRMQLYELELAPANYSFLLIIIDAFRFTFLPCLLLWMIYSYFVYGCLLGFMYTYRRAEQWRSQKNGAVAASLSWSFRVPSERSSVLHRFKERTNAKPGFLSRLNAANRSWHSSKSADNPTLRAYSRKCDDDVCPSVLSDDMNTTYGSENSLENNNLNRSICAFNLSHRLLDTVVEEAESQESTGQEMVVVVLL